MADRIGTLLNRSGDGGEEVLIVSRGSVRTRFRRRDELGWTGVPQNSPVLEALPGGRNRVTCMAVFEA